LDRQIANNFGSNPYAKEELIAEMTAAYLCGHAGIEQSIIENQAAYLAGWIEALKGDARLAIQAASAAQKAANYILATA
jgi:antirestriction protein ArdC